MVAEQVKKCLVTVHPTYPCGCVGGGLDGCEVRLCLPCARVRPCVPAPPGVSIHITICVLCAVSDSQLFHGRSSHGQGDPVNVDSDFLRGGR